MKKVLITLIIIVANFLTSFAQSYPTMITVEGGTFTMGDTKMEGDKNDELTHQITLNTFKIAKTETTVAQWKLFCDATARNMPNAPKWGWLNNHPIVNVNYDDAVAYCEWLSKATNAKYRLPTEAEWEYAARGGKYSKGYSCSGGDADELEEVAWYSPFSFSTVTTQSVGQFKANELGIFDMSGNVWEWCLDWYETYNITPQTNPKGPTSGKYRMLRGGGFYSDYLNCRVAKRRGNSPSSFDEGRGFRVVLSQ